MKPRVVLAAVLVILAVLAATVAYVMGIAISVTLVPILVLAGIVLVALAVTAKRPSDGGGHAPKV